MQKEVVRSEQSVTIAARDAESAVKKSEGESKAIKLKAEAEADATRLKAGAEAERITVTGKAEAEKKLAIGKSEAEAYRLAVEAMGSENFATFKVTEAIGINKIKVMPDVLIGGGNGQGGSSLEGLLGYQLMEKMNTKKEVIETPAVVVEPSETMKK
jgi:membrane protein involved in colicin uptake